MEGGEPVPDRSRTAIGNHPSSFTPDYSKSTVKSAADVAVAESKAKGAAINAKAAEEAAKKAAVEAEQKANSDKKVLEDIEKLKKTEAKTVVEKEAKEKKLKELQGKADAAVEEKTKDALANADTKTDKDVTLLKTKNAKK
ncbi:MAG: hypothetical protein VXZ35_00740 [Pseudomonadota bacterium]|nr:hypothetical protein [Pseudomonadota bacterium]